MARMSKPKTETPVDDPIDENLRLVYQAIVDEGTPDKFMILLKKLQEKQDRK